MGRIFLCQNLFLTSPFEFFSRIFRHLATWPRDRSAAHSTQWQDLELTFHNTARENGKGCVCVSETSGSVDARVSETHVSRTFPCTKRRKQSSVECCRPLKVIPIRRRSPFPHQTDTQNAVCATYIHANSTRRNFRTRKR